MNKTTIQPALTREELASLLDARAALGQAEDALATARFHARQAGDNDSALRFAALIDQVFAERQRIAGILAARL